VKLSLWKLRWRSWWNGITRGGIHGIEEDEQEQKRRTFAEWLHDFLEADAAYYEQFYEPDDWDAQREPMPGGDDFYGDEMDDGVLETLLIGGLVAALAWLIYYRQQQQRAAEQRRRQGQDGEQNQQQQPPPAPGQQPDGGFFPQPGDPNRNAWIAGGAGL
jgi:SEL1 protein